VDLVLFNLAKELNSVWGTVGLVIAKQPLSEETFLRGLVIVVGGIGQMTNAMVYMTPQWRRTEGIEAVRLLKADRYNTNL